MARLFAFPCHRILDARYSNAISLHSPLVRILNLGCPVLGAFQGRGFWCGWPCANCEMHFPIKDRKSKAPPVTQRDRWGTRSSKSKAGAPALRRTSQALARISHKALNGVLNKSFIDGPKNRQRSRWNRLQPVGFAQTSQAEACSTENIYKRPFHVPVAGKRDSRSSRYEKFGLAEVKHKKRGCHANWQPFFVRVVI